MQGSRRTLLGIGIKAKLNRVAFSVFEETPVLFAYVYGSFVKGVTHPFSDLDVGIFVEGLTTRACLDLELSLALRIDESLGHVVQSEVRVMNHLPLVVKGRIVTNGELIYSRAEDQRIEFETQTRKLYFILNHLRDILNFEAFIATRFLFSLTANPADPIDPARRCFTIFPFAGYRAPFSNSTNPTNQTLVYGPCILHN